MSSEKNERKNRRKKGAERHVVSMGTGARTSGKHGKNGEKHWRNSRETAEGAE